MSFAPADAWTAPTELVTATVCGTGAAEIMRRRIRGVVFQPTARVWRVGDGLRAELAVKSSGRHGDGSPLVVKLSPLLQENLG